MFAKLLITTPLQNTSGQLLTRVHLQEFQILRKLQWVVFRKTHESIPLSSALKIIILVLALTALSPKILKGLERSFMAFI